MLPGFTMTETNTDSSPSTFTSSHPSLCFESHTRVTRVFPEAKTLHPTTIAPALQWHGARAPQPQPPPATHQKFNTTPTITRYNHDYPKLSRQPETKSSSKLNPGNSTWPITQNLEPPRSSNPDHLMVNSSGHELDYDRASSSRNLPTLDRLTAANETDTLDHSRLGLHTSNDCHHRHRAQTNHQPFFPDTSFTTPSSSKAPTLSVSQIIRDTQISFL